MLCKTWSDDINLLTGQPVLLAKSQIIASESFKRCELGPPGLAAARHANSFSMIASVSLIKFIALVLSGVFRQGRALRWTGFLPHPLHRGCC